MPGTQVIVSDTLTSIEEPTLKVNLDIEIVLLLLRIFWLVDVKTFYWTGLVRNTFGKLDKSTTFSYMD